MLVPQITDYYFINAKFYWTCPDYVELCIVGASPFRHQVVRMWYRTLKRRSQRHTIRWDRFEPYSDRWIPRARILHPWPSERFYATHPR